MVFDAVPDVVRRRMSRIRKADTKPELLVRRIAHRLGYRFRVNRRGLPGTPDIVFPRHRKIIFVHGCFWHQHPGCRHAIIPKIRLDYWLPKLARTAERDAANITALAGAGWETLVIWECETVKVNHLESRIRGFLAERSS